ncbi:hypothetical protein [Winogradskyella helgolandensis]|uniref:hypothetical protein n=1 Tax=Winogradskyella helgolandensis TaxID=2697010 RepID=UPI0015B95642|nr:hypothetical protein [Winogradskyella helgolandensis]
MKYIKLILILFFFGSCSINKSVIGLYGKCKKNYLACTQIELKSDKTFEYFIFMDVGGGTVVKGNWEQISKDSIKLNTFEQPKNPSTTYSGKINPDRIDNVKITIRDFELPLAAAFIEINDQNEGKAADVNGITELKAQEIKTITYHYIGQKETIKIDNQNFNEIEIIVRDLDLNAVPSFLTDKIMVLNNGKLFFNDGYSLKKTNLKNRQWK